MLQPRRPEAGFSERKQELPGRDCALSGVTG